MKTVWTGRVLSAIPVLMLLFSAAVKFMRTPAVVQGFAQYGFPDKMILVIAIIELGCVVVYLIPRTAVLGAILMTGLLGGATVTNLRVGDPLYFVPVLLGILAWAGLFLRDSRLRALIPLRRLD